MYPYLINSFFFFFLQILFASNRVLKMIQCIVRTPSVARDQTSVLISLNDCKLKKHDFQFLSPFTAENSTTFNLNDYDRKKERDFQTDIKVTPVF